MSPFEPTFIDLLGSLVLFSLFIWTWVTRRR